MKAELLDKAIRELQDKTPRKKSTFGNVDGEITSLVSIAEQLLTLPRKEVPSPAMQRKYILAAQPSRKSFFLLHLARFVQMGIAAIVFMLLGSTTYAAMNSLPGEKFFKLKKTAENIQLKFTTDPVKKANLQLAFTERRLNEAQSIIMGPHKNPELEAAALNELTDQTKNAIEDVKSVTASNSIQKTDHPIVAKLEDVSNKQKELLSQIKNQSNGSTVALNAIAQAQDNQDKIKEIIHIVAASNEETKATLEPQKVTASTTIDTTASLKTLSSTTPATTTAIKKPEVIKKTDKTEASETSSSTPSSTNTAIGTFILEDPTSSGQ